MSGLKWEELADIPYLFVLNLHHNKLSGEIPANLGKSPHLAVLYLHHNNLTGDVPEELGRLPLQVLHLKANKLTGCLPPGLRNVDNHDFDELGLPFCQ